MIIGSDIFGFISDNSWINCKISTFNSASLVNEYGYVKNAVTLVLSNKSNF